MEKQLVTIYGFETSAIITLAVKCRQKGMVIINTVNTCTLIGQHKAILRILFSQYNYLLHI